MDPETMGAALGGAGKLFQGFFAFLGSRAEKKALNQAADMRRREAGIEGGIALDQGERLAAHGAVVAASSGGAGVSGSAIDVLAGLAQQSMHNARTAIYRGETEARGLNYRARVASLNGKLALINSATDAGSSFLSQSGQAAQAKRGPSAPSTFDVSRDAPFGGGGLAFPDPLSSRYR